MFKLVILHILSKLRFIFYPFATFPDPLEYLERKSALDLRADELVARNAYLDDRSRNLQKRELLVDEKEKRLAHQSIVLSRNEFRMMQGFRETYEVELTDMYGRKIYATKKGSW